MDATNRTRTGGGGILGVPEQRRSDSSALLHRIVAARASAVVLEREGDPAGAAQLRAEADGLELLEPVRVRVRRPTTP